MWRWLFVMLAACGRLAFDPVAPGDAATRTDSPATGDGGAPTTGLVGWWKLDDAMGSTAIDSSGNGNTGTLMGGPTWGAGEIGGALGFAGDASGQFVDVPDAAVLQLAGSWTVATWVNLTALPAAGDYDTLVAKSTAGGFANYNLLVDNGHVNAGMGWMIAYNGNGVGACGIANAESPSPPSLGTWTHLASVYDETAQTLTLYVDGAAVAVSDETDCAPAQTGGGEDLTLGTEYGGGVTMLAGVLDDVHVYNRALSAAEITQVMTP